ncbi:MAG TPA: dienelactone hydrolase family protein [Acidimicrobiales bacterium]|nr:dienelactone hydrolase family protein [Acidimicrobiales bacterium]
MAPATRYEPIGVDGDSFDAYCAVPESGRGPGLLMFQEIFGINDNMRGLAERTAGAGYLTLVPDMFWRIERRFERRGEEAMQDAFAMVQRFDWDNAPSDIGAAHRHLLGMPECTGKVGAIGFCFGGSLAFLAATRSRVNGKGPDAAVCYYGSAINDMLSLADHLDCPTLFHYGNEDPYLPADKIAQVESAVGQRPNVEIYRYDGAGHAFSNWDSPSMYNQAAAELAWSRTLEFLDRHLG